MSTDASLPSDLEACQRELVAARHQLAHTESVLAETAVACEEQRARIEKLQAELELFKRYLFGRRSERFEDPGQGRLFEQPADGEAPTPELPAAAEEEITYRRRRQGHGWSELPAHLPREEVPLDVPESERICDCCGEPMVKIGEDRTERVDYRPAKIVMKVFVTPKYACPKKHGGVKQAETPPGPVPGGRFDFGMVAQVVTSKTCDHLPLYRQQDVLARAGIELSRSTLCEIMASAAFLLAPLALLLKQRLLASDWLGADDTPVRLLDPAHPAGVRQARFWLYRGPDTAPYNVFDFHESHSRDGPREFLDAYQGWVKVDAYGVDGGVYLGNARIRASCCLAHARRKFDEAKSSHPSLAAEALGYFQQLYDIEDRARDLTAQARQALRQAEAVPLLAKFRAWADQQSVHALPKLKLGEALGYLGNQWEELTNYVQSGRLPIDNNAVERDLRALTIGRKNWLFVGSKEAGPRAAILYTVVTSAARHDLDVWAYLRDVLERLAIGDTDPANLLPDVWAAAHPQAIRTYRAHEREAAAVAQRARRQRRRALERAKAQRR
ncbi:MAG: IS66 family transposase [Planctomycetaceae bacterium]|nr:IS66 family transposase [Planctomycetaceae bacterium]